MNIKKIIYLSSIIGIHIVMTEITAFKVAVFEIGLGFIPMSVMAMLFGSMYTALGMLISDILGFILIPSPYGFHIGFTLSNVLSGGIYGYFLYVNKKKKNNSVAGKNYFMKIVGAVGITTIFINITLNTYWLTSLLGRGYLALVPIRIVKNIVTFFFQIAVIKIVSYKVKFLNYSSE